MTTYSFGISGLVIWLFHIIIGIFLFYSGFQLMTKKSLNDLSITGLIVLGALAVTYHTHLLLYNTFLKKSSNVEEHK